MSASSLKFLFPLLVRDESVHSRIITDKHASQRATFCAFSDSRYRNETDFTASLINYDLFSLNQSKQYVGQTLRIHDGLTH